MAIYKDRRSNLKSFTMVELVVVIIVIGILAYISAPQINKAIEKSRQAEAIEVLARIYRGYKILVIDGFLDESSYRYNPSSARRLTNQTSGTWNPVIAGADWDWEVLEFDGNPNSYADYFYFDFLPNGIPAAQAGGGPPGRNCASEWNSFLSSSNNLALAVRRNSDGSKDCVKYIYIDCQTGSITKSSSY